MLVNSVLLFVLLDGKFGVWTMEPGCSLCCKRCNKVV